MPSNLTQRSLVALTRGAAAMLMILMGLLGVSQPVSAANGNLVNISTRALVETGDEVMIGGFIIADSPKMVLVQARGTELANDDPSLTDLLADPVLSIISNDTGEELMANDNWEDSQGQEITEAWNGSPNLMMGSLSAAAIITLDPGNYTAIVRGKNATAGLAQVEVYDLDSAGTNGRLVNISTRALVETGDEVMIGGFIIADSPKTVLVQARGTELANDDPSLTDLLADPVLSIISNDTGEELMANDNWEDSQGQEITEAWNGSPNLMMGSLSAAAIITLDPGNYTAIVRGKNATAGLAQVEVYDLDSPGSGDPEFEAFSGLRIGDDGSVTLRVGGITLSAGNTGCISGGANLNGLLYDYHWTAWQHNTGSGWTEVPDSRQTDGLCGYDLMSATPGKYRLVGDMTLAGVRGLYMSENEVTVEEGPGNAPADQAAFDMLVVGKQVGSDANNTLIFLSPGRIREIDEGTPFEGNYEYVNTGANTGTLTYTYDATNNDPAVEKTVVEITFTSEGLGTFVSTYTESGSSPEVVRGPFELTDAGGADRFPSFRNAVAPVNQTYMVGTAIDPLTLPEASDGDGTLTYRLSPEVPGLTFDPNTRRLAGTPTTADTYNMTYTVTDEDGDTDSLGFVITVGGTSYQARTFDLDVNNSSPHGIAYAKGRIHVVDRGEDKVFAYSADGQRDAVADFDLDAENGTPEGITYANGRFYVVDSFHDKVFVYGADGQRDAAADFNLDTENGDPQGITYVDGSFHVVDSFDVKVFVYGADGQRDAAADFNLDALNLIPEGITYADGRFYVVDSLFDKVFAYGADGQRDAAADFDLHDENDYSGGIAHGDGRFHVVNWLDVKAAFVYSPSSTGGPGMDSMPSFGDEGDPDDPAYIVGTAIQILTLPSATGGDGVLRYDLVPVVPGLTFDTSTRRLTGTPTSAGTYNMTYTVTDEDGDTDSLNFSITVEHSGDSGGTVYDPYQTYLTGDPLPNVPTSGSFNPAALSSGGISSTASGTSIFLAQEGYFVLDDGTRYTCTSADGCGIENGTVTRGSVLVGAISLSAENSDASGVAYFEGRIYVTDAADRKVYAYSAAGQRDPSADFSLNAGGVYPGGIAYADGRFVVVDESPLRASAYSVSGQREPTADFDLDAENDRPHGIVHANGRFYVVDVVDDKVYAYLESGQRDASSDFDLDAENSGPTGIVHANDRFYVVDINEDKVFAYSETVQRDAAADFDLYNDNRGPYGITYHNGRFIVVDALQDRVYFYPGTEIGLHFLEGFSTTRTMPENLPSGINVGEPVTATGGNMLSYTIGGTDVDSFNIVPETGQIRTAENVTYDFETKNEYQVEVSVEDESGDSETIDVTIFLLDLVPSCGSSDDLNLRINPADRHLTLRWSPVQHTMGQQGVAGYETEIRRGDNGAWGDRRTFLGHNITGMIYADLINEISYQVRVRPINAEGTCGWSEPVSGIPTVDRAPENSEDLFDRHGQLPLGTEERNIRFLTTERFRHTSGGVTLDADYRYHRTGPDTGRIFLDFDDPSRGSCEVTMAYSSLTAGSFIDECFDAGLNMDVPFDTSFRMPSPQPSESEPQRSPRDQDEFDALVHELDDFIPGLCFGYCGIPRTPGVSPARGVATRITHHDDRTNFAYGDYTYENTGPSQGIVSLTMRKTGEMWSFTLDVEPSGNIRVTVTPPDGGEIAWPGMQHLDLTLGAQSVLLPIPPSWSAAIAVETDVAPADLDGLHSLVRGTCESDGQPAMCTLLGDVWDRAFIGPEGEALPALDHNLNYRKVGPNRGTVSVQWTLADWASHSDLSPFQTELLGTTWAFDLTFTSDGAAYSVLTISEDGHLPSVEESFVDFVGDGIDLGTFPDELLLPDQPPQESGEDLAGVEVAAAITTPQIGSDDLQTLLVSAEGGDYKPGDWLEPKDGGDQRMMIVSAGASASVAVSDYAPQFYQLGEDVTADSKTIVDFPPYMIPDINEAGAVQSSAVISATNEMELRQPTSIAALDHAPQLHLSFEKAMSALGPQFYQPGGDVTAGFKTNVDLLPYTISGIKGIGALQSNAVVPMTIETDFIQLTVVCMQIERDIPLRGGRYFSVAKEAEGPVQTCQKECVLNESTNIQGCVWGCEF